MRDISFLLFVIWILSGCYTPVNLNFDSSRMLGKGAVEIQGSASTYSYQTENDDLKTWNQNVGGKIGIGFSEKYNLKFRFEALFYSDGLNRNYAATYLEWENKFKLGNNFALSIPLGTYIDRYLGGISYIILDPRLYTTIYRGENFELSIIPKCHLFLGSGFAFMPGISFGAGFSSNLNKWSIRPEIGYDRFFSAGIAFSLNLNNK